jgi:sulfoquinovosidase
VRTWLRWTLVVFLTLVLTTQGAVVWRLPPAATDLADPPEGELTVEAPGSWQVGGFEVTLTDGEGEGEGRLAVTHPDAAAPVWETPANTAFVTAAVADTEWRDDFGLLRVSSEHVSTWAAQTVTAAVLDDGALRLSGELASASGDRDRATWQAVLRAGAPGRLDVSVAVTTDDAPAPDRVYLVAGLDPEERVHGLGGQTGSFDLRGRWVPVLPREQGVGRGDQPLSFLVDMAAASAGGPDTTYLTSAVHVTSRSRGLAYTGGRISSVDLRPDDRMVWEVWDDSASFSAVAATTPLDAVALHSTWAGAAEPPPAWLGTGLVAGLQGGTADVRRKVQALQEAGVPLAAVWLQDWSGQRVVDFGARLQWNWTLDEQRYPGWDELVRDLDAQGVRVLTYANPFLSRDSGRTAAEAGGRDLFAEAEELGHLVLDADGDPYELDQRGFDAALVDLSSATAREWLTDVLVDEVAGAGARGWMADFGEGPPSDAVLDGGTGAQWRARWPVLWQQVNTAAMRRAGLAEEGFVWHRSAHSESAGAADSLWLGDQMQNWSAEDGLGSVPALLHAAAASGMAQVHGDVGGYTSLALPVLDDVNRDAELMVRWAEASVLGPVLRTHEGNRPAEVAQPAADPSLARQLASVTRLFAALEPERRRLTADGGPLAGAQHHPWMVFPDEPELLGADSQTMLGRDVLLVPVLEAGADRVEGLLPPGRWTHVWSGKEYGDRAAVTRERLSAPLGEPVVLLRSGSRVADELARSLGQ